MKNIYQLTIAFTLFLNTGVFGETLYDENFEQGSSALDVWMNEWARGPNSIGVESGALVVRGSRLEMITGDPRVADLANTSVRARVSMDGTSSGGIGLMTNGDPDARVVYQAGIDPDNSELYLGWNDPTSFRAFKTASTDLDPIAGDELMLQFDVFQREEGGYDMKLWAWLAGDPMPAQAQLTHIETSVNLEPGEPAFIFDNLAAPGTSSVRVHEYQVSNISIPEPNTQAMAIAIIGPMLVWLRGKRRS